MFPALENMAGRQSSISKFFAPTATASQSKQQHRQQPEIIVLSDSDNDEEDDNVTKVARQGLAAKDSPPDNSITVMKEATKEESPKPSVDSTRVLLAAAVSTDESTTTTAEASKSDIKDEIANDSDNNVEDTTDDPREESVATTCLATCNPFAQFAATAVSCESSSKRLSNSIDLSKWMAPPKKKPRPACKTTTASSSSTWVRMEELSKDEQERVVEKWHSMMVVNDNNAASDEASTMEDQRWQIFVAARLHARCQDGPVRRAMKNLHACLCPAHGPTLSVSLLATVDPLVWTESIKNLQYYPTKARHIHQAAQEIIQNFQAKVPERAADLKTLTGIGPVLADLLAFVNTRKVHEERKSSSGQPPKLTVQS